MENATQPHEGTDCFAVTVLKPEADLLEREKVELRNEGNQPNDKKGLLGNALFSISVNGVATPHPGRCKLLLHPSVREGFQRDGEISPLTENVRMRSLLEIFRFRRPEFCVALKPKKLCRTLQPRGTIGVASPYLQKVSISVSYPGAFNIGATSRDEVDQARQQLEEAHATLGRYQTRIAQLEQQGPRDQMEIDRESPEPHRIQQQRLLHLATTPVEISDEEWPEVAVSHVLYAWEGLKQSPIAVKAEVWLRTGITEEAVTDRSVRGGRLPRSSLWRLSTRAAGGVTPMCRPWP